MDDTPAAERVADAVREAGLVAATAPQTFTVAEVMAGRRFLVRRPHRPSAGTGPRWRLATLTSLCLVSLSVVLVLALVVSLGARRHSGPVPGSTLHGGTAYLAEQPETPPNWILPFENPGQYDPANAQDFQYLMFRPLYWMGRGDQPTLNDDLSLASPPQFSNGDRTVTIDLKAVSWSDGAPVDAQDVLFFMNMLRAEKRNFYAYFPGELPDNIASVSASSPSSSTVVFALRRPYNAEWFTLNQLDEITPMPVAWDINHLVAGQPAPAGSGGCSSLVWNSKTAAACRGVWRFLTDNNGQSKSPREAGDLATYASNPLWQVVDGPFRLSRYSPDGYVTFVPNTHYFGGASRIDKFVEVPTSSDAEEYSLLVRGKVSVGYLPIEDAPTAPSPGTPGLNPIALSGHYSIQLAQPWTFLAVPFNYNSVGDAGAAGHIFKQLYFRQALQMLDDESTVLASAYRNYGVPGDGPVPLQPATGFLSSGETTNPYPFDVGAATSLLASHGWSITPGKADICSASAGCGAGVPSGARLSLNLVFAAGIPGLLQELQLEAADWAKAGILVRLVPETFNEVLATVFGCSSAKPCTWEMAAYDGWSYAPSGYPSGDETLTSTAPFNVGGYTSSYEDHLVNASITSPGIGPLYKWENYVAEQLPVLWQPTPCPPAEVATSLGGVVQNPLGLINPEDWYFVK